jgi:hypothetical protein
VGRVLLTFTGASTGEATVRLERDNYKSTVRVDVASGTVLELPDGTYQIRISVRGYRGGARTVRVRCGQDEAVVAGLTRN